MFCFFCFVFFLNKIYRVEALAIKKSHGMAKLLGSSIGVTGALVFALVKGPQLNFMKGNTRGTHSSNLNYSLKEEWLKGSLVMVLANFTWSLWLILQVYLITSESRVNLSVLLIIKNVSFYI